jgi:LDH2 family malate/lactate/ureidoglycolate dehydrogenase
MPILPDPTDGVAVRPDLLRAWTAALVGSIGTTDDIAADVAEILVAADRRGIPSHGTARLPNYLALVSAGVMDPAARPVAEVERAALVRYDARNGWGHHAGRVATDRAIEMARTAGSAFVVLRNSNHYGIAGWYALRAAAAGMIGMSLSNTSPLVAPTRARVSMLGTNPIAVAAPAGRFGALCLDMATSTIPRGRIEVAARRGENLLEGWAIDAEGRPALTPEAALEGALMPLGGGEATAGYKGYGLALVVDMLTAVLSGATSGPSVVGLFSTDAASDLGQAFWVVDPAVLDGSAGPFEQRLEALCADLVAAPTAPGAPDRVLIPGEPEAAAERLSERRGVVLDGRHHAALVGLGETAGLPFPEVGPVQPAAFSSLVAS